MQVYLVGGAVRDKLLGKIPTERDFVVVGSTPEEMIAKGFKPVGKDFPVFLHPETHDEYALARTERKVSRGYKGFTVYAAPDVSLEEDLKRRDLTINAIAEDENGHLIDLFNGQRDLKQHILRHVSEAFVEDPVRILRVARFAARLPYFSVAEETIHLMHQMVQNGEVDALVPERIWQELHQALCEEHPARFFEVLRECGALKAIFPEIDALFGVPNPPKWHPEIDTGLHTLMSLEAAVKLTKDPVIRFAVLLHDLGKAATPKSEWPKHHAHGQRGVPIIKALCKRIRAPHEYTELALLTAANHSRCLDIKGSSAESVLKLLQDLDAFRRPERFEKFLVACIADAHGRIDFETIPPPQTKFLQEAYDICAKIEIPEEIKALEDRKIMEFIHQARLEKLKPLFL